MIPEEKIYFVISTKIPGLEEDQTQAEMMLSYKKAFPKDRVPDAYETVLRAVIKGDQTKCGFFLSSRGVVAENLIDYSRPGRRADRLLGYLHSVSCNTCARFVTRLMSTRLLHYIESEESPRPISYEYGSNGPEEANELEKRVGFC